jgi:peptidoglycan L-alanyl-D-glutamate endopeptidase CwlK
MDWAGPHYDCLGEVMQARGLVWGGSWNTLDRPHVQWPGYVTAKELAPLLPLMKDASTPDVQKRLQNAWAVVK